MRTCTFPECTRLARYGALCSGHEKQAQRGRPLTPLKPMRVVKTFVHSCVGNRRRDTGCWTDWPYAVIKKSGRPVMADPTRPGRGGRMIPVARYVVFLIEGAWPKSACHHCDNPTCWNPDHLYGGDQSTNNHDAIRRGRRPTKETAQ